MLVRPIGISPLPILMARRSHCLRRLTASGRFNARTVTERKYQGSCTLSGKPATACLRHEPCRSCRSRKMIFPSENGSHGGPVTGTFPLSCSGIVLFSFQGSSRLVLTSGHCGPKYFASHKPFHFSA